MKKKIKLTENELKQIIAESVNRVLSEGVMAGAMRRAYNTGRYDKDGMGLPSLEDYTDYIKGDKNANDEAYDFWKKNYEKDKATEKERYGDKPNEKLNNGLGYSEWTHKAYAQDYTDNSATNALLKKPGVKGKITRAAAAPLMTASAGAGRLMKKIKRN